MKKAIKRVFVVYTLLFLMIIIYLLKLCLVDSKEFVNNSMNPRLSMSAEEICRGEIQDINGNTLVKSVKDGEGYKRSYPTSGNYSHILGYTVNGKSGVESAYNFELETVSFELFQRAKNALTGEDIKGDTVVLTVDDDIQQLAAKKLAGKRGSVVVAQPDTGRIVAMVSNPAFDSNKVSENWNALISVEVNTALLNRSTQGLYPPGSTFKIITSMSVLQTDPALANYVYACTGSKKVGFSVLHCFNSNAHGNVDIKHAFAQSCNTFFVDVGLQIGNNNLINTARGAMFDSPLDFPLPYSKAVFGLSENSDINELAETSIGQGKTLVSPLYMCMLTSAVANNGIMMKPYILDHTVSSFGAVKKKTIPERLAKICEPSVAYSIKEYMIEAVNSGTARQTQIDGYSTVSDYTVSGDPIYKSNSVQVAGKTGTAENSMGADHSWFTAFAPANDPKITVTVLLENSGHGDECEYICADIMKEYLQKHS